MSLERKDLRLKLDPDVHAGLLLLADTDGVELNECAERVLAEYVRSRIHKATLIATKAARLGLTGNAGDASGNFGESAGARGVAP